MSSRQPKPRIAVFSGPTATVQNSPPLVTSNKARAEHELPLLRDPAGAPIRFDALRLQRLAAPVTVYVEQFSAHPLERDAAGLYGPPDGYVDAAGVFRTERQGPDDKPVYAITLRPEDGLYPLPYMARQADGQPWEGECSYPLSPAEASRQTFYPDASRIFEEIDRLGMDGTIGHSNLLNTKADFDFYRAAPSGGYQRGLPERMRTDLGVGDIPAERPGEDYFAYRPPHLRRDPALAVLARLTNCVHEAMASRRYAGAIWLEGSPTVEETIYWLGLLIDTPVPIVGNASQRPHGSLGNDGDSNVVGAVEYILSGIWADESGRDAVGAVVIQEEQIFTAREVQKADARPGGYVATGGHGGIVGTMGEPGPPVLTFRPVRRSTSASAVNMTRLPASVPGVRGTGERLETVSVRVKDERGALLADALPTVTIVKYARYLADHSTDDQSTELEILTRIEHNLQGRPLAGFVAEGTAPFGSTSNPMDAALRQAVLRGMPVVKVARGNAEGFVPPNPQGLFITGNNLTATKARLLLMACLLRFGALPPAADLDQPSESDLEGLHAKLREYQAVFDSH